MEASVQLEVKAGRERAERTERVLENIRLRGGASRVLTEGRSQRACAKSRRRVSTGVLNGLVCGGRGFGNECISPAKVIAGHFMYSRASACV